MVTQIARELLFMGAELERPRMSVEQEKLAANFPGFNVQTTQGLIKSIQGVLSTKYGNMYLTKLEVPAKYPYFMPRVWLPFEPLPFSCPHRFKDGSLCIMHPDGWKSIFSLAFAVARTAIWVDKYDAWRRTGQWPGREQPH